LAVKFNIGDRVRYNSNGTYFSWDGAEGIVVGVHSPLVSVKLTTSVKQFEVGSIIGLTKEYLSVLEEDYKQAKKPALPFSQGGAPEVFSKGGFTSAVEHPAHYGGDNPYEVIKVAEAWGLDKDAYLFNVLKYVARAGKKVDNPILQDLKKGLFYYQRRIKQLEAAVADNS
jgi:hypothetical protein